MEILSVFGHTGGTNNMCRLKKALYGLKQSPLFDLKDSQKSWCIWTISKVKETIYYFSSIREYNLLYFLRMLKILLL